MKIYLTKEQWSKLWHDFSKWECTGNDPEFATLETYTIATENQIEVNNRTRLFKDMFPTLKYEETLIEKNSMIMIHIHTEKDIGEQSKEMKKILRYSY